MALNRWQLRNRIIARLHKMRNELSQTITDMEWWNENRTDAEPFDIGFERSLIHCVNNQIDAWEANDMDAMNRWQDRMSEIAGALQ